VTPELKNAMTGYAWPGNVRELENAVERMVLLARSSEISISDLPDFLRSQPQTDGAVVSLPQHNISLVEVEKQMILEALKRCGGNQTRAARYLGMSRRTLAYRLEKYGVGGDAWKPLRRGAG
jgi:two-component system NtrC family response regulator